MADRQLYPTGVRPGSKGGIEIRWKFQNQAYSEYLPDSPTTAGIKKAAAIRKERIKQQKLAAEFGIRVDQDTEASIKPFSVIAQEYLHSADLEASTYGNYKNHLNRYWMPALAQLPMSLITTKDIRGVMHSLKDLSRKTQRNILIPVRQVFKFAQDMEYVTADPSASISIRKSQKPVLEPFSLEERESILEHLTGQDYFFFLVAFETGARCPSELLALTWDDFDGKTLSITKARVIRRLKMNTKTNEARKVLVTQRLRKELLKQKLKASSEWIFTNSAGQVCRDADLFNLAWKKALASADVRYRRPYNCRHTFASLGLKAGAKPAFLASQLGHSLQMFYTTYAAWIRDDDDVDELRRIENYTGGGRKGGRKQGGDELSD